MPFPLIPLAIGGISALAGKLAGSGNKQPDPSQQLTELFRQLPQLQQTVDLQAKQAQRQDPLHAALTQLALNLLPKYAFSNFAGRPSVDMPTNMPAAPLGMPREMDPDRRMY